MAYQFILASASPRRKEILTQAGIPFEVMPSDFEERAECKEPEEYVKSIALGKAEMVAEKQAGEERLEGTQSAERQWIILGADTIVAHRNGILTKPADRADAFRMLKLLQGDTHEVFTGIALLKRDRDGKFQKKCFAARTEVVFYPMSEEEIEGYLDLGEYADKAGAYAIQGKSAVYIREIRGDYYNVVGLPLSAIMMALKEWGIAAGDLYG